jgi:hypothetical protein
MPARHFGTLLQVRKDWVYQSHHYIGTKLIPLPPQCTSTIVPPKLIVAATQEYLSKWNTQSLHSYQKICEMDLWRTFFCNSHLINRGAKQLCFKREYSNTEYWIEVLDSDDVAQEWRKSSDFAPLLTESTSGMKDLPFDWQKWENLYYIRINGLAHFSLARKLHLDIEVDNRAKSYTFHEDMTGRVEDCYAKLLRNSWINLNPFLALHFSNASSIKELKLFTSNGHSNKMVTLTGVT